MRSYPDGKATSEWSGIVDAHIPSSKDNRDNQNQNLRNPNTLF